jgi:hypothetical protein
MISRLRRESTGNPVPSNQHFWKPKDFYLKVPGILQPYARFLTF